MTHVELSTFGYSQTTGNRQDSPSIAYIQTPTFESPQPPSNHQDTSSMAYVQSSTAENGQTNSIYQDSSSTVAFARSYSFESDRASGVALNRNKKSTAADHKDSMHRYVTVSGPDQNKDHYLRSSDGKLELLRVQSVPSYSKQPEQEWRTWQRPKVGLFARLARRIRAAPREIVAWTFNDWINKEDNENGQEILMCIKYPVASFALGATALFGEVDVDVFLNGRYEPVRYGYFRYPKIARNVREGREEGRESVSAQQTTDFQLSHLDQRTTQSEETIHPTRQVLARSDGSDVVFGRHLRPRMLCVIDHDASEGYRVVDVDLWDSQREDRESGAYIFVSYTRLQFQTYKTISEKHEPSEGLRRRLEAMYAPDLNELVAIGMAAAEAANLRAFWIDVLCLPGRIADLDSHRICDIARGADRMVLAIKDEPRARVSPGYSPAHFKTLLHGWASRLWTLPELLLAPTKHDLAVYWVRANHPSSTQYPAEIIPKRNMAERAYEDGLLTRQLVDHFESSLHLTQTELLTIGLQCLLNRKFRPFLKADPIYALMTLARRRPIPRKDESLFEAFAQLSLMNDSNMLLERLLCVLPPQRGLPWANLEDFWKVKLWEINPNVQVAAITDDESVLIDGAYGASIEWEALNSVGFIKRRTVWRTIGGLLVQGALFKFLTFLAATIFINTLEAGPLTKSILGFFVALLVMNIILLAYLPWWALSMYRGKFWGTQARLIGLEGVADIKWLETKLFGICDNRLKWTENASTQSRHRPKPETSKQYLEDECEAIQPVAEPIPLTSKPSEENPVYPDRLFTLVDTYTLTVTVFRAVHPPSVALVCGQEGGMRRTLLCSYNYKTQTFHRETVVRMPTKVLDRMDRVPKFRFSMTCMPILRSSRNVSGGLEPVFDNDYLNALQRRSV